MADADLDVLIRSLAKQTNKTLMAAAKKRRERYMAMAAGTKNKEAKDRYRLIAKDTLLNATAAAKRILTSSDNAAASYSRAMKKAAEEAAAAAKKPAKAETADKVKKTPGKRLKAQA